jgi:hypothetical protein
VTPINKRGHKRKGPQISTEVKVHFSLPFPTYFTLKTKSEFGTTRAEKGIEDNFLNKHPILIK